MKTIKTTPSEGFNSETTNNNTNPNNGDKMTNRDIKLIWEELINHPDYITTGPEELFTVQSLLDTFKEDYEDENDNELTDVEVVKLEEMIRNSKRNISDTIWEFFRSPFEYSHWKDECEEYQQFIGQ